MNDLYEWDDVKASSNYLKHGVSFEEAIEVFSDPHYIEREDASMLYGEERYIATGIATNGLITVVYTEREDRIRIISARHATKREYDSYYHQN